MFPVRWRGRDLLLTGSSYDGTVALYDLGLPDNFEAAHDQQVIGVALTAPEDIVVSADAGGTIVARHINNGKLLAAPLVTGVEPTLAVEAWHVDDDVIAATGSGSIHVSDQKLRRWNLSNGSPYGEPIKAHRRFVPSLSRVPVAGNDVLVTVGPPLVQPVGHPSVIRLWRLSDGELLGEFSTNTRSMITGFAAGVTGGRPVGVVSTFSEPLTLVVLDDPKEPPHRIPQAGKDIVLDIADSYIVAVTSTREHTPGREIHVWDITGSRFGGFQGNTYVTAAVVREWPTAYIGWADGAVSLVDLAAGSDVCTQLQFPRRPTTLAAIRNGGLIVGFGSDLASVRPPIG
ncbi:WD40 repeat domain-containing protein [Actinomadura adrarensis]|uniref:WD40 repeat domain-containing protein n=1 Tax=Actinomadura adrarensis TaxID=1819600 RepID=A0ABW3C941_9ACTN